jgi:chromate transporter
VAGAPTSSLREVAGLFAKLGVIGFGGPAAHIAMMRDEVVRRRGWVTDQEFLDMVGACNLVPGPNSTELAIHLGHRRAGWRGLLVAGACFILPAVLIVGILAWLYAHHGTSPEAFDLRYGILPVVVAIVAAAVWGLARTAVKDATTGLLALGAGAAWLAGVNELLLLAAGAVAAFGWAHRPGLRSFVVPAVAAAYDDQIARLFVVFLKVGAVLYGSGYVLLSFLEGELVDDLGWLTRTQLLDAIAVGQITPGPVFTTATFVGYQIDGLAGAAVATLGIFLPSFLFVAALGRIMAWFGQSAAARAALDGVNAVSLGMMAGVTVRLADTALVDPFTVAVGAAALGLLVWKRPNSAWLMGAGVLIGALRAL